MESLRGGTELSRLLSMTDLFHFSVTGTRLRKENPEPVSQVGWCIARSDAGVGAVSEADASRHWWQTSLRKKVAKGLPSN
eukprot:49667-Eustigmatos_ZCMA.PRE.1